ncbi:ABC transporter ATP-binding protein [uncultured Allobaculum sp.]|uniref:ATP-binding cassette domain-containing protein n=1 Tax=uncultured Allobaculum sp. TaxID=1187017 RepID=UPI00259508C0|nr:ABC transporter ATP-binding protein [uncultured Allobaculum sp.]
MLQSSTFGPFLALANLSTGLSSTLGAARRVLTLFDEEVTVRENEKGACPESSAMAVENLAFAYDDQAILESLSLSFPEGKITGIEGRSGCGKSTLLRLLMRFFDPQAGTARLGDENLKDVQTDFLRTKQSVVLQESVLFTDTLRNNLLAAKPDATDKEIRRACKKASIDTFIDSLDQGLDTMLAESGSSLSSGEKQRIGLARAFLHDGDILLLDEPTSNLDALNEGTILRALDEEAKGKTVVLISHRKGTLSFADHIIEMEELHSHAVQ